MTGLELAREYYMRHGRAALERSVPELAARLAVGLAGEGSECFGFDDALSRDHDWGPAFCIWMEEDDFRAHGKTVQAVYDRLPRVLDGYAATRRGGTGRSAAAASGACASSSGLRATPACRKARKRFPSGGACPRLFSQPRPTARFLPTRRGISRPSGKSFCGFTPRMCASRRSWRAPRSWRRPGSITIPAACGAGTRWRPSLRSRSLPGPRCPWCICSTGGMRRFTNGCTAACAVCPSFRAPGSSSRHSAVQHDADAEERIEGVCLAVATELRRQGLSGRTDAFLQEHCMEMMGRIKDPALRRAHIMEE